MAAGAFDCISVFVFLCVIEEVNFKKHFCPVLQPLQYIHLEIHQIIVIFFSRYVADSVLRLTVLASVGEGFVEIVIFNKSDVDARTFEFFVLGMTSATASGFIPFRIQFSNDGY